jgi:hypothetical protein
MSYAEYHAKKVQPKDKGVILQTFEKIAEREKKLAAASAPGGHGGRRVKGI